jgi:hypothetical protein
VPIIVRAESESNARHLAVLKTLKFFPAISGGPISHNPWTGHKKLEDPAPPPILCEDITEQTDEYSVDGPAEVLRHGEQFSRSANSWKWRPSRVRSSAVYRHRLR